MSGSWILPEPKPHFCRKPGVIGRAWGRLILLRADLDGAVWACNDCDAHWRWSDQTDTSWPKWNRIYPEGVKET